MRGDLLQKMIKRWGRKTATNVKKINPTNERGTLRERERDVTTDNMPMIGSVNIATQRKDCRHRLPAQVLQRNMKETEIVS